MRSQTIGSCGVMLTLAGLTTLTFATPEDTTTSLRSIADWMTSATNTQINVTTLEDTSDVNPGDGLCADADGGCSLRAAVQEANALGGPRTIRLDADATYVLTIAGADENQAATGDLDISGNITIRGRNSTLDASGLDRAFDVMVGAALEVRKLHVINGAVTDANRGAYRNSGILDVRQSSIMQCSARGVGASGGAISNESGELNVRTTIMMSNTSTRAGGAIEAVAGATLIRNCEMLNNETGPGPGNGGAFHLTGAGDVVVRDSLIEGNIAAREGGGLWNSGVGKMSVRDCEILGNVANGTAADDGGGGLFNDGGQRLVRHCSIRENDATTGAGSGGGVFNNAGHVELRNCTVELNMSNRAGGGIEAREGTTMIEDSVLNFNMTGPSPGNGGALHLTGAGAVWVSGSQIMANLATAEGGGLWNANAGTMIVDDCTLRDNVATGDDPDQGGGGLFNDGGVMEVVSTTLIENIANGASGSGGGVMNNLGVLSLEDCIFVQNNASRAGGGIEANVGETMLDGVVLLLNVAGDSPGNGGGLHLTGAGDVDIFGGLVVLNAATTEGGGLWNASTGTMTVAGTAIFLNAAPVGADVFNDGGDFTVDGDAVRADD